MPARRSMRRVREAPTGWRTSKEKCVFEHEEIDSLQKSLELRHRSISQEQMGRFEQYIAEIFEACGMDLHTSGTEETPQRFLQALLEATNGYEGDPKLIKVFDAPSQNEVGERINQVIEGPIAFFALCEHHALPFYGQAYIGYLPRQQIIGISKLTRFVRLYAKRFTVQERLGQQIAGALETLMQPYGVAVYLEAHHLCVGMRGVQDAHSSTRTTCWKGAYVESASLRSEFLQASRD